MWDAASSSEDILISKASLEGLPPASAAVGGMRRFFDISVPRNIASDVNQLDGDAHVYNVDDLKEVVAANTASRQRAAREAEVLLAEEQRDFESWRDSLATVPTIKVCHGSSLHEMYCRFRGTFRSRAHPEARMQSACCQQQTRPSCTKHGVHPDTCWRPVLQALRAKAEAIRSSELERTMSRLPDSLSKKERRAVEDCTKSIVNKLLHGCMASLRCDGSDSAVGPHGIANAQLGKLAEAFCKCGHLGVGDAHHSRMPKTTTSYSFPELVTAAIAEPRADFCRMCPCRQCQRCWTT